MELSKDIMIAFDQVSIDTRRSEHRMGSLQHMHGREVPSANISMYVSVLTMGFWPTYQPVSANLPAEVRCGTFGLK